MTEPDYYRTFFTVGAIVGAVLGSLLTAAIHRGWLDPKRESGWRDLYRLTSFIPPASDKTGRKP